MNNSSLISIIVPCYNQSQYMDECLQSVFDQTYHNWECIIVNDESPDDTEEVAKKWTAKDSRFKYLLKQNGGLSSARNAGINIAQGEWILPLDCDDKIGNLYLELAEKEFNNGYTVIYAKAHFFGEINEEWNLREYNYNNLLIFNHIYCSAFYKKEDWKKVGGYDTNLIYGREDWDFWISILEEKSKVKLLDYLGFYYRRKLNSMDVEINNDSKKKLYSENYIYTKHLKKYLEYEENAISNYKIVTQKLKESSLINHQINKHPINRFLFKIIKLLS